MLFILYLNLDYNGVISVFHFSFFSSILETSLSFMTVTAKLSEQHSQDAGGKFWKAVLHRAYDIVDKVNNWALVFYMK